MIRNYGKYWDRKIMFTNGGFTAILCTCNIAEYLCSRNPKKGATPVPGPTSIMGRVGSSGK